MKIFQNDPESIGCYRYCILQVADVYQWCFDFKYTLLGCCVVFDGVDVFDDDIPIARGDCIEELAIYADMHGLKLDKYWNNIQLTHYYKIPENKIHS